MQGYKPSLCKILSAAAALAFLLPQLALGDYGVCPPYSKTFGPDDPPGDIVAFMNSASTRPGGATVMLEPGSYELAGIDPVSGVLCVRGLVEDEATAPQVSGSEFVIDTTGILSLESLGFSRIVARSGAILFAVAIAQQDQRDPCDEEEHVGLIVDAGAQAHIDESSFHGVSNAGVLSMSDSVVRDAGGKCYSDSWGALPCVTAVDNRGFALLEQVSIHDIDGGYHQECWTTVLGNSGIASLRGTTVQDKPDPYESEAVENEGHLELMSSVLGDCWSGGSLLDLGYNVVVGCPLTAPTSVNADPQFADVPELGAGSPAIDRVPLELCNETDGLGRARTDGNGDGTVACDAGAREYGYTSVEVEVRTTPYWRTVGKIDLSRDTALFIAVMSGGPIDPTSILFESIVVGDFPRSAMRGVSYHDKNGDGLSDYNFWYRLDRALELECRYYDEPFTAMTDDGQRVTGRLQFEVLGCTG